MNDIVKNEQVLESGFFDIEGRIGRSKYAVINLFAFIVALPIFAWIGTRSLGSHLFFGFLFFLVMSPTIVKRLHDIDRGGVWVLGLFVPILNIIVQLRLLFQPGSQGANRFGLRPRKEKGIFDATLIARHKRKGDSPESSRTSSSPIADDVYDAIAEELESGILDKGLWTRLFAQCDGDEAKTKVHYINERASRLSADQHSDASPNTQLDKIRTKTIDKAKQVSAIEKSPRERERAMEDMIKRMS